MPFTLHGEQAEIRYGYHVAATLGAWDIEGRVISARITRLVNRWWLTRPGLSFVLPRKNGSTSARAIEAVEIAGDIVTAYLTKGSA
jgi:hypothetical protein